MQAWDKLPLPNKSSIDTSILPKELLVTAPLPLLSFFDGLYKFRLCADKNEKRPLQRIITYIFEDKKTSENYIVSLLLRYNSESTIITIVTTSRNLLYSNQSFLHDHEYESSVYYCPSLFNLDNIITQVLIKELFARALIDYKNLLDRKNDPKIISYPKNPIYPCASCQEWRSPLFTVYELRIEPTARSFILLKCSHVFHGKCRPIMCPICQTPVSKDGFILCKKMPERIYLSIPPIAPLEVNDEEHKDL
jgi:hypothetical protein